MVDAAAIAAARFRAQRTRVMAIDAMVDLAQAYEELQLRADEDPDRFFELLQEIANRYPKGSHHARAAAAESVARCLEALAACFRITPP